MPNNIDDKTLFARHTDKIVQKLDDFPELLQALRDADLLTARLFCARLFNCGIAPLNESEGKPPRRHHPHDTE